MYTKPSNTIDISEATLNDFEGIFKLLSQLWPDRELNRNTLLSIFSASIDSPDYFYICAIRDGRIIGFCSLIIRISFWQEGLIGHINQLIIDESCRQIGISAELLDAAIAAAKNEGCKRIELDSAFHRQNAHRFYENAGLTMRAYLFSKEL
jgi:GNAT superfamily N-acetyltransferase